ncbi:hypothetical protein MINT15_03950 [Saccharomonospora viridis]|uniref:Uncharacterized protein n=1 Tax=Saccharomonospora viridis TaxID=1852 RepID=A0A837DIC3_9PSEU|nr:hypothetical protein MINT15_03950 [Saccharomonospora viridis]
MPGMFIFRGLPGSGETTHARELRFALDGTVVGCDHLRELLFGLDRYRPSNKQRRR